MTSGTTGKQIGAVADDEKVAKVFVVMADGLGRKCLICDRIFSRQASFEHSKTICYPPASNAN